MLCPCFLTSRSSYVCHDKHDSLSLQKLGPLLRLSTKYGVEDWRKRIIAFFEAEWPTTLKGWDALEIEIDSLIRSLGLSGEAIDEHLPEPGMLHHHGASQSRIS